MTSLQPPYSALMRQIEDEISAIENGRRDALSGGLPDELEGVARNLNLLIESERARSERYRHTLDNLAHSLKTPLAAIRAVVEENPAMAEGDKIESQVERMHFPEESNQAAQRERRATQAPARPPHTNPPARCR